MNGGLPAARVERRARPWAGTARAKKALASIILIGLVAFLILTAQLKEVSLEHLLSLGVWGVMLGGIIALGGIGISLVYGVLRFANFAHGDLMTTGAYIVLALLPILPRGAPLKPFSFGWEFLVALLLTMPLIGLSAFAIDRVIYRPLRARRSSGIILAMASLGMAFFIRSLVYLGWGADFRFYYVGRERPALRLPLGIRVRPDQFFILGVALLLVFLLYLLLERTKMGKAMRATADNPELARVSGINTEKVIFWTWVIGGALAAAGGVLLGLNAQLSPMMGWWLLLPLFAAVILGGIGNPYGALVGGLIIGIIQQVATAFLNPAYAPGVSFLIMVIVLLVRPQGIFGKPGG
jgi:branched-chain amino acid transport system permease protein